MILYETFIYFIFGQIVTPGNPEISTVAGHTDVAARSDIPDRGTVESLFAPGTGWRAWCLGPWNDRSITAMAGGLDQSAE